MGYSLHPSSDHCYEGTTCLINKLGIRDEARLAEVEAQITFAKDGNTYMNFTINGNNANNVDPNRGIIYDNFFWADEIPEGFVADKYVAPVEPAPAA